MKAPDINPSTQERRDRGFAIGLLTGTVVGAGLTMWLAPRAATEICQRVTDSARRLGRGASDRYQQASAGVGEAVGEIRRKGRGVRDDAADAIARGAHEVERYAMASKSGPPVPREVKT